MIVNVQYLISGGFVTWKISKASHSLLTRCCGISYDSKLSIVCPLRDYIYIFSFFKLS